MDYSHFAIALLLLSVTIVFAEIFLPSGGMLSFLALSTIAASIVCAWYAWFETNPAAFWSFLMASFVLFPTAIAAALYVFPMTPMGKLALLEPQRLEDLDGDNAYENRLQAQLGRTGRTAGLLTPGGVVVVQGERWNCESEGMLIEAGVEVVVVAIKGRGLVVREVTDAPAESSHFGDRSSGDLGSDDLGLAFEDESEPPLDFPISQG
jgi:membrane-bound ClpP family serine protease